MQVTLYRYSGKANVLEKNLPTSAANRLIINADYGFEGNQDVDRIYININSTSKPLWTYAYIDTFYRYYFVTNTTWLSGSVWRLSLRCDLLQTFASTIKTQSGTVIYSGMGDSRRYDPRLVYNLPPVKTSISPTTLTDTGDATGGNPYIVMAIRYMDPTPPTASQRADNQMRYIVFSTQAYFCFAGALYRMSQFDDATATAISNCIVSVTLVRWLNMNGFTPCSRYVEFASPEIFAITNNFAPYPVRCVYDESGSEPYPGPYDVWEIKAEDYHNKVYLAFADTCLTYADRKAQRLLDLPYIGQLNIDLDNLGLPSYTGYYLCAEISYDFGGNEYVVCLGSGATSITLASSVSYQRVDYTTFSNTYTANFISDASYSAETETRAAQILSILGTAAAGVVSGIMTEGATVPATIASLGIGAANFALSEQKIEYQKAASMKMNGTSNGGSPYNTLISYVATPQPHIVYPAATLYKKTSNSSTDPTTFQAEYGKPDGAFRTLSALAGTGYAQMGTVTLDGFNSATEIERDEIKNLLLSGVIY